jgi:hypothetical protein
MSLPARFQRKKHPRALPAAPRRCEPTQVQLKPRLVCFVDAQSIWAQMERDRATERAIRLWRSMFYPEMLPLLPTPIPNYNVYYSVITNGRQVVSTVPLYIGCN